MKQPESNRKRRALLLLGALAAFTVTIACSKDKVASAKPVEAAPAQHHVASVKTVAMTMPEAQPVSTPTVPQKKDPAKLNVFRSRDYAVSFQYPWQYAYASAMTINSNDSLRPNPDGHEGQVTLARIDIPQGYYPDTDFESAYFALSLNQNMKEEECTAASGNGTANTESIHGVDFKWAETDLGGNGKASKVRDYFAFANGTCYEVEMALKTSNTDGLAREINPDQVFQRLNAMLQTVKIKPDLKNAPVESATAAPQPQQ